MVRFVGVVGGEVEGFKDVGGVFCEGTGLGGEV